MRAQSLQSWLGSAHHSFLCWATAIITLLIAQEVNADLYLLKSGGQISGTEIKRGKQQEYIVRTDQGATVTLSRRQVDKVERLSDIDQQYEQRSRVLPDRVEAHREMAAWCKKNRLSKLSQLHLQRIVELDPNDEEARMSLGYQQHKGRWMTRDEIMTARGLIRFDGDYRTPQDILLREEAEKRKQAESEWFRNIRMWVGWLNNRKSNEAVKNITAVKDPLAAPAIVRVLEREKNQRIRDLLTATMAELQHPIVVTTLVDFSLYEPDREVRLQCVDYLLRYHKPIRLKPYVDALNSRRNENHIINRSAEALELIGDPKAISPLIDALVTTHRVKISDAPPGNTSASFTPSGGGGFSAGKKPEFRDKNFPNHKVHHALVELSGGHEYEFDVKSWRRWFVKQQIQEYVDTRRDQ